MSVLSSVHFGFRFSKEDTNLDCRCHLSDDHFADRNVDRGDAIFLTSVESAGDYQEWWLDAISLDVTD